MRFIIGQTTNENNALPREIGWGLYMAQIVLGDFRRRELRDPDDFILRIGDLRLSSLSDTSFWLSHKSGEGMEVSEKVIEELLLKLFTDKF